MLEPEHVEYLVGEAARTGLSRSELIRRALDETYRPEARSNRGQAGRATLTKQPTPLRSTA